MAEHGDKSAFFSHGLVIHGYQSAPLTVWFWQPIFCHPPITGIIPDITTGFVTIIHSTNNVRRRLKTSWVWANSNRTRILQLSCWNKRYSKYRNGKNIFHLVYIFMLQYSTTVAFPTVEVEWIKIKGIVVLVSTCIELHSFLLNINWNTLLHQSVNKGMLTKGLLFCQAQPQFISN